MNDLGIDKVEHIKGDKSVSEKDLEDPKIEFYYDDGTQVPVEEDPNIDEMIAKDNPDPKIAHLKHIIKTKDKELHRQYEFNKKLMNHMLETEEKPKKHVHHKTINQHLKTLKPATSKPKTNLWIFVAIPLIIIAYLLVRHYVLPTTTSSFYDIGSESDAKTSFLTPAVRISNITNGTRTLTGNNVYFSALMPRNYDRVDVEAKILANISFNNVIYISAKKNATAYTQFIAYSPLIEELNEHRYWGDDVRIYAINGSATALAEIKDAKVASNMKIVPLDNDLKIKPTTINTTLRGRHRLYVYVKDSINLTVQKQDLNWYNNTDDLTMTISDINGMYITNTTIKDDGITIKGDLGMIQSGTLYQELEEGVYIIDFAEFDGLIRQININTDKIVTNRIFLADSAIYTGKTVPTQLYYSADTPSQLSFAALHKEGYQDIYLNSEKLTITNASVKNLPVAAKEYMIKIPKNDIAISSAKGFITFNKENYFEPYLVNVEPLPTSLNQLNSFNYVIMDMSAYKNYKYMDKDNVIYASFKANETFLNKEKLDFMISLQKFSANETVVIDYININVRENGIFQK